MCLQCDGYSYEQSMLELDLLIQVHGWALVQVEGDVTSWSYTVGLTENYGHPELAMTTVRLELQSAVIHRLVDDIVETGHLDLDLVAERELELVEVHPTYFIQEWFGTWSNHYERPPAPGGFLQIVPPASWFCDSHASATPRLDRPGHTPDGNRATRRRRR